MKIMKKKKTTTEKPRPQNAEIVGSLDHFNHK